MQHLWSMSMRGQFFVATLLGALALGGILVRRTSHPRFGDPQTIRRIVGLALLAVTLVSFLWANYRHAVNQPVNYYDTMARLWSRWPAACSPYGCHAWCWSRRVRNVLTVGALLLIVTCGWWIKGRRGYRSAMALVPVDATLLIIWTGSAAARPGDAPNLDVDDRRDVNARMASPFMVWLGGIAYALYLIHWPLLIFFLSWRRWRPRDLPRGTGILLVSGVLACGHPLRRNAAARGRDTGFSRATAASSSSGWSLRPSRPGRRRSPGSATRPTCA